MAIKITQTQTNSILDAAIAARKSKKRLTPEQKIALVEYDARQNAALSQARGQAERAKRPTDAEREETAKEAVRDRIAARKQDKAATPKPKEETSTLDVERPKSTSTPVVGLEQKSFQTYLYSPTSGRALWTLTHCVLLINRQFDGKHRPWVPKGNISNFYNSSTVVSHHLKQGNFESNEKGYIRLSVSGHNYFMARINGMNPNQRIDKKMVDDCMAVLTGPSIKNQTKEIKIVSTI